ncbi:hypothetical protein [Clostridium sp. FP1]|uniref:hypothetical protein n=1 Tax=Clostridium sp. FP1 TaxID=2724076 RepID=UPI0013E90907|nr:hypothetical protein [Clostridium sp. FP1]MBZ9633026.1 hypothetical protein [Clostridium sp. FP1]MBZ9633151.1 hypothetical protein [Clostridium sp. FP1]
MNELNNELCKTCGLNHKKILANGKNIDESRKEFLIIGLGGKQKYGEVIRELSEIIRKYNLDSTPNTFKDLLDQLKYITLHKF